MGDRLIPSSQTIVSVIATKINAEESLVPSNEASVDHSSQEEVSKCWRNVEMGLFGLGVGTKCQRLWRLVRTHLLNVQSKLYNIICKLDNVLICSTNH